MQTVLLDAEKHQRKLFDCGNSALNNYLSLMANQQSKRDNTRTYVLEDSNDPSRIIGYYTLTMSEITMSSLSNKLQKQHHNNHSAGLIARLAVDKSWQKQGYGEWLLIDALRNLLKANQIVPFPFVILDAKDGQKAFYERYGFRALNDKPVKLFMTIKDIRGSI